MADSTRYLSHRILTKAEKSDRYIDRVLQYELSHSKIEPAAKHWITELVMGVTRWQLQVDFLIGRAFHGNFRKAQPELKTLLRMSVYQLRFMKTPSYAAVNEAVELSKQVNLGKASGLVNAVLRKTVDVDLAKALDEAKFKGTKRLSVEFSHPEWLLNRWLREHDEATVRERCHYNNTIPSNWLRYNPLRVERQSWESFLTENESEWTTDPRFPDFYKVKNFGALFQSTGFSGGWFTVQDAAAGLAPRLLAPKPGDLVLDLCAAPGGKSTYLAELANGQATVRAYDSAAVRLEQMRLNFQRLDIPNLSVFQADVTTADLPEADKILLDVPCSGSGVLNRRVDLRWRRTPNDIQDLVDIQAKMLENGWRALKPGGVLVYSTCSLEPEENWHQIEAFMIKQSSAVIERPNDQKLAEFVDERGALMTIPERDHVDGMFVVKLRKPL
ncbi:MAG: 16S rRNA (cytosine(967)-C(5))-methyltransferase [Candidatus Marinimicrobia bacterium CG1_02_48_14]|nr:MAG: 16S rRNA (cytosine(967)-C(5))-methyltransferase [Candidatus Marinimicrobia bacterium CG1_02_48_14]